MRTLHSQDRKTEIALKELEEMVAAANASISSMSSVSAPKNILHKAANHVAGAEDGVAIDATGGAKTVYLDPSVSSGKEYLASKRDSSANAVTVNGMGKTINGDATLVLQYENSAAQMVFTGTEWIVM